MRQLTPNQTAEASKLANSIAAKLKANPALVSKIRSAGVHNFLKDSETKLLQQMDILPVPPGGPGSLEFGHMLLRTARDFPVLHNAMALPAPSLTTNQLALRQNAIAGPGIISSEGDIIGSGTYEMLDPGWLLSLLHYWATLIGVTQTVPFGTTPARVKVSGPLTIAIVGDWGTGVWDDEGLICPAVQVMSQIANLKPDITVHLGDVYYSGTAGEETDNFVPNWLTPSQYNFSLNSNHEMYDGGNGYFSVLLNDPRFACQTKTSYFSIETDGFVIFGLDSAYYDQSSLFMDGSIGTAIDPSQSGFIRATNTAGKRIIVLTHHNGLPLNGSAPTSPLWSEVMTAFSATVPDFWFWGHLHNGVVYSTAAQAGKTKVRCLGHGALPMSVPTELLPNGKLLPSVDYLAKSPLQSPNPDQENRVMNGFAFLTLSGSSIREDYYNQAGTVEYSV